MTSRITPGRAVSAALLCSVRFACLALTAVVLLFAALPNVALAKEGESQRKAFDVPAGPAASTLKTFIAQSGVQLLYAPGEVKDVRTRAVKGEFTPDEAIGLMLAETKLVSQVADNGAISVSRAMDPNVERAIVEKSVRPERSGKTELDEKGESVVELDTFEVFGRKTLNMDLQRTRDDPQPYVTYDRGQIDRSMASNLEDFLKNRLPMNAIEGAPSQNGQTSQSAINLRGLGTNQTLVLVDGRRLPGVFNGFGFNQPDINGIPLAAVERVEVLPSTASGIFGGGATGGVVNIITRRNYSGLDVALTYANTFQSDSAIRKVDVSGGISRNDGRTSVRFSVSHSDSNALNTGDRDFAARARLLLFRNNPSAFTNLATPPVAYTPNIRSTDGSNLVLDGGTALGSSRTFVPIGYRGVATDSGQALIANAGSYNLGLPDTAFGARRSLLSHPTVDSASFDLRQKVGSRVEAFAELGWYKNHGIISFGPGLPSSVTLAGTAPNNPFTTTIAVSFPSTTLILPLESESETIRTTAGVIARVTDTWMAEADYSWSRSRTSQWLTSPAVGDPDGTGTGISSGTALSTGVLDVVKDLNQYPLDFTPYLLRSPNDISGPLDYILKDATLRLAGPVLQLPAGPLTASFLVQYRKEDALTAFRERLSPLAVEAHTVYIARSQSVASAYSEARIPLIGKERSLPLVRALDAQLSVRHDRYKTHAPFPSSAPVASRAGPLPAVTYDHNRFDATKFTAGLRYEVIQGMALRASFGSGFLPPAISQIAPFPSVAGQTLTLIDPKRGNTSASVGPITVTQGGNPSLYPESSESVSAGIIIEPKLLSGLRLSIDYTRVSKVDEIVSTPSNQQILDFEDAFPGRITRLPVSSADSALGYTGGAITAINATAINISRSRIEAFDIQADYRIDARSLGKVEFYALATWQPMLERQTLPTSPQVNSAGFIFSPLKWRGNGGLNWSIGNWEFGWNAQYFDSYYVYSPTSSAAAISAAVLNQGAARIPSQWYHDLFVRYRIGKGGRLDRFGLAGTDMTVGVQNIFEQEPPILAGTGTTGGYSNYGDPRLRRYSITLRRSF